MPCFMSSKANPSFFLLLFFCLFLFLFSASATFSLPGIDGVGGKVAETIKSMAEAKNTSLVLAKERTRRRDFFHHFRLYNGGWNISDEYYVTRGSWFLEFFYSSPVRVTAVVTESQMAILNGSITSPASCLSSAPLQQYKFHETSSDTLDYVVGQAESVAENLMNVSSYFDSAKQLVVGFPVPLDLGSDLDDLKKNVTTAARSISKKTNDKSKTIRDVIDGVRLALIIAVAVMLFVTFVGFINDVVFGGGCSLVMIGWILVTVTLLLCGAFLFVHNMAGDACVGMDEWVANPSAYTALDEILPCVENQTAVEAFVKSKSVTEAVVKAFDTVISNVTNGEGMVNYNQSGPLVPLLCNPFNADFTPRRCAAGEVTVENATEVWKSYTCEVNPSGVCTSEGRLTPSAYRNLASAVHVTHGLFHYGPFFIDLLDCRFARKAFAHISSDYCPSLQKYTRWVYWGSLLLSVAVMLSLLFSIVFVREHSHLLHPYSF
ncbi:hypothetical protein Fmac_012903 [Flemingia macrophylla]|uniref:Transmembrane protein n=1 Tax=Flemingia macrophylla TaxID=520843 RepID=A0ABD1MRL8_9FABA